MLNQVTHSCGGPAHMFDIKVYYFKIAHLFRRSLLWTLVRFNRPRPFGKCCAYCRWAFHGEKVKVRSTSPSRVARQLALGWPLCVPYLGKGVIRQNSLMKTKRRQHDRARTCCWRLNYFNPIWTECFCLIMNEIDSFANFRVMHSTKYLV